jgi:glycosyltransferase involved in cell wall biosynthesis
MTNTHEITETSDPAVLPDHPVVSVYMPAYNHESFVAEAIEGVLRQVTDFPIELIVAEDASTDATRSIVLDYQRRNSHVIRVITGPTNVGARANYKRTRHLFRGHFVAFCEGDDFWTDPTKLQRQVDLFKTYPACSLVFHSAQILDANNGRMLRCLRWSNFSRRFTIEELILGDGGMIPTASILVTRSVLEGQRPWALDAPIGDYPLVLSAALAGDVLYLDRCMSAYRWNVPQSWTQRHVPTLVHRIVYARQIEAMLIGFSEEAPLAALGASRAVISKYYSDVIVRLDADPDERRAAYAEGAGKMFGSDRWLAWLAATLGYRLILAKDVIRKTKTIFRLVKSQLRRDLRLRESS